MVDCCQISSGETISNEAGQMGHPSSGFIEARNVRREIVKNLEQQQGADAHVALKIRDEILGTHRRILESFIRFLKASVEDTSNQSRSVFETVLSVKDFEEWLSFARQRLDLLESTSAKKLALDAAQKRYEGHSPLGPVSRLFSDDSEKRVSLALKAERDALAAELAKLKGSLAFVEIEVKTKARDFMVGGSSSENLARIARMPSVIQTDLATILSESKERMDEIWRDHSKLQLSALQEVSESIEKLSHKYEIQSS